MEEIRKLLKRLDKKVDNLEAKLTEESEEISLEGVLSISKKLDSLGRITLPIAFRRHLQIEDNEELDVILANNQIIIKKQDTTE